MSNDSLAFFLVYCSVFTLTILYIGVKLSKNWRKRRLLAEAAETEESADPSRCNHAICRQAHAEANHLLPYTGLGAIWIPDLIHMENGHGSANLPGLVHNTSSCNNSCDSCRKLSQPPPSYTKLFLDDSPPSYTDAVVMEAGHLADIFTTPGPHEVELDTEFSSFPSHDLLVRIPEPTVPALEPIPGAKLEFLHETLPDGEIGSGTTAQTGI